MRLLSTRQVARFVARGFLQADSIVPAEINAAAVEELKAGAYARSEPPGTPLDRLWPDLAMGRALRLPEVRGILSSLLGAELEYLLHAPQVVRARLTAGYLGWHSDVDLVDVAGFKVHVLYFPHDTPKEMGGTMLLPGSHLARVGGGDLAHIHNFLDQQQVVCSAGTMVFAHYNIWHSAQRNTTDKDRYMLKVRVGATPLQRPRWSSDDFDHPEVATHLAWCPRWISGDAIEVADRRKALWDWLRPGPAEGGSAAATS